VLLTPPGGIEHPAVRPGDQLAVGNLTYDATNRAERLMRVNLYLLESLQYYDFLFRKSGQGTEWWWLISNPSDPNGLPGEAFGPYATPSIVPPLDFLASKHFLHVGTWDVLTRSRDAFSGHNRDKAPPTWYWFDNGSNHLARIMNIDIRNDFAVAVLGAYYLVDVPTFQPSAASNLGEVYRRCPHAGGRPPLRPMVTLTDLLTAMAAPPSGAQISCSLKQIQALIPGISCPVRAIKRPAWTNRVSSQCYIIGQECTPHYSQVWYDWNRGAQVTVFVKQDAGGQYTRRIDELLLKGTVGPEIHYSWGGTLWKPDCCNPKGAGVPMPVPDFVARDGGRCRAVLSNNSYFGNLSIWSCKLEFGDRRGNFWFWFNDRQRGVSDRSRVRRNSPQFNSCVDR
jgi:hypothetical protein